MQSSHPINIEALLTHIPLFNGLAPEEISRIARSTREITTNKGGILFTFSCSQVVDKELFYATVMSAAIEANREVKILHYLSQPADHPINIFHPEGSYLKGLVLYVN